MRLPNLVIILLLVMPSLVTQAADIEQNNENLKYKSDYSCGSETQVGITFKYCIRHVDRLKNEDVIYFFHGLGGDEETWFTQTFGTGMIERKWHWRGYDPTVVTVSFGQAWLLVNNERFQLLPYFEKVVMPFLEGKIGGLKSGKRMAIGQSMGGFNAAEAVLQRPGFFSRVALLCPAITTIGPFSSPEEIQEYIDRTGASPDKVQLLLEISQKVFVDQQDWKRHDPLKLLSTYRGIKPSLFVSTGMEDDYGFQEGSELFASIGRKENFKTTWVPVGGGHCNFDRRTTANFIMEGRSDDRY